MLFLNTLLVFYREPLALHCIGMYPTLHNKQGPKVSSPEILVSVKMSSTCLKWPYMVKML